MPFFDTLPIDEFRGQIERVVVGNPVVILTAETGAGKSTRVPYWFWKKGKTIHITQPRRIAARSLSHYLSRSLDIGLGREIGFQTGFEVKKSSATSLLFLTDGVKMVQEIRGNRPYDILVLDEIHEWNLNQEILVGLVRKNLESGYFRKTGKRVIIMSATLQADRISSFFSDAPVLSIPGRSFPVSQHRHDPVFFLADVAQLVAEQHNVLVFQPGKKEIDDFSRELQCMLQEDRVKAEILPLHSELSLKDQSRVFLHYHHPKVVVATDIAQTSLTIDDIDAVVDCGLKKEVRIVNGIEGLYPVEISASECCQRAGRAGRVKPGAYILCSDRGVDDRPEFPEPEIRRLNLETAILRMVNWGLDLVGFPFFHKPRKSLMEQGLKNLQVFGAIDEENRVTADGRRISEYPVSVRSSRILLEAEKGGVETVDRALKIISIMETKGIVGKDYNGERAGTGPFQSDLLNQLDLWETAKRNRFALSGKKMAMALEIYQELRRRLNLPLTRKALTPEGYRMLFRAVISGCADGIFTRGEGYYTNGRDNRQLERSSIFNLAQVKPEMIAAIPFDLSFTKTNPMTAQSEEVFVSLLTFCSEVSFDLLDELQPFSYSRVTDIRVREGRVEIHESRFFGGVLLDERERQPDWESEADRGAIMEQALPWIREHFEQAPLAEQREKNRLWLGEISRRLPPRFRDFEPLWERFVERETRSNLRQQDVAQFLHGHPGFARVRLDSLLPAALIRRLVRAGWPKKIEAAGGEWRVERRSGKPFIRITRPGFERFTPADALLPSGEEAGIEMEGTVYEGYREALAEFNHDLRLRLFKEKWFFDRKKARLQDLLEVPFPVSFIGGKGKDDVPFEYYSAPLLEGEEVFLIHFATREEAEIHLRGQRKRWEKAVYAFKKNGIEDLFRQKGWKVKS